MTSMAAHLDAEIGRLLARLAAALHDMDRTVPEEGEGLIPVTMAVRHGAASPCA